MKSPEDYLFAVPGEFIDYLYPKYRSKYKIKIDEDKVGRILANRYNKYYKNMRVADEEIDYRDIDDSSELIVLDIFDFPEGLTVILNGQELEPAETDQDDLIYYLEQAIENKDPEDFRELIQGLHPQNFFKIVNTIPYDDVDSAYIRAVFEPEDSVALDYFTTLPAIEYEDTNYGDYSKRVEEDIDRFILHSVQYSMYRVQYDIAIKIINRIADKKSNVPYLEYFVSEMYNNIGEDLEDYLEEEVQLLELLKEKIRNS
jgi:hypothetical protein